MQAKELISADFEKIIVWDINKGEVNACIESSQHGEAHDTINVVKRDPHHKNLICMGLEQGFCQIDLRAPTNKSASQRIAHSDLLTDLDYNPNKLNTLVTCGQDSFLRFWDLRKLDRCLLEFEDDSHWLNCVKYNRFHDQLLISGTSSTFLQLYRASSVSQAPLSSVPLADLNASTTFMMTTMGDGFDTERMTTYRAGGSAQQDDS